MSDDWGTPQWLMSMFDDWFDPCPLGAWHHNGLNLEWGVYSDRIYVNPPYSNPMPWVEKAIFENTEHGCTVVLLLKHDSSTRWYAKLKEAGARFLMIEGRLKYEGPNSRACAFPSVLAVLAGVEE